MVWFSHFFIFQNINFKLFNFFVFSKKIEMLFTRKYKSIKYLTTHSLKLKTKPKL